jgi:hypothetical protein
MSGFYDPDIEADRLEDEREEPRRRSPYRCVRRDCGALDCSNCYPMGYHEHNEDDEADAADFMRRHEQGI